MSVHSFEKIKKRKFVQIPSTNEEKKLNPQTSVSHKDLSSPSSSLTLTTKNKKRKKKHLSDEQRVLTDMSDERLQVYGLNPKRFRNFVRFNKDKKD
ncbi:unnamed protein product [Rotaria magnacalcarata]|uniref:Uncharacterized protein n=1 Tax=Rotaria magnacalcarata TaxID=392030 RepID=A0A816BNH2_9BILA|nr:unnamed protein product [Rotaria magnacalcarata]CAF1613777.1 unnamed protein product [Rotaria magnacalcarata]CAF4345850.1 unnamed protein product [Rotaria magnacalcarata]CAF5127688.1 unnamed protein product [Rotaria magnacalcarata]